MRGQFAPAVAGGKQKCNATVSTVPGGGVAQAVRKREPSQRVSPIGRSNSQGRGFVFNCETRPRRVSRREAVWLRADRLGYSRTAHTWRPGRVLPKLVARARSRTNSRPAGLSVGRRPPPTQYFVIATILCTCAPTSPLVTVTPLSPADRGRQNIWLLPSAEYCTFAAFRLLERFQF